MAIGSAMRVIVSDVVRSDAEDSYAEMTAKGLLPSCIPSICADGHNCCMLST
jgi:hypothetical protein